MADSQGTDIQLSVGLSLEDVKDQARKLESSVSKIFDIDSSKLTSGMTKLKSTMSKVSSQAEEITSKIEIMENKMANVERFQELESELENIANQYNELAVKQEELVAKRDSITGKGTVKEKFAIQQEIDAITASMDELTAAGEPLAQEMAELIKLGHNVWTDQDTVQLETYRNRLGDLNNQQKLNITAFEGMQEQQKREAEAAAEAARLEQEHAEAIQRTREAAGELDPAIAGTINHLRDLATEEAQLRQRLDELAEAQVDVSGYEEYDNINARLQQIAQERVQANREIQQYDQQQLDLLNQQQTEEERIRQLEEERARAQERAVAIIRGDLNPEVAEMVDRYNQVGARIRELEADLQRMEQEGHGLGYRHYDETIAEISQLRQEYRQLQDSIDQYAQSLTYEGQERQRLEEAARQRIESARVENQEMVDMTNRYRELGQQLEDLRRRQQELADSGIGAGYEEYDRLTNAIAKTQQEYDRLENEIQQYNSQIAEATTQTNTFRERMAQLGQTLGGAVQNGLQLVGRGIQRLVSHLTQGRNASNSFGSSFKQMLKKIFAYGLGIASLTALFSKMRAAITSGIQSMAKMNGGVNQTNALMTQLTSSLNLLKGSLATAFLPILNVVSPILSNLIQQLASVINFIGMFIAKMTGAKSYSKAVFKSTDYASSLNKSGGSKGKTAEQKYEEAVKKAQKKYDKKVAETEKKNAEKMAKAEEKQAKAAEKYAKAQEKANNKLAAFDDLNVLAIDEMEELQDVQADLEEMPELELPSLEDYTNAGGGGGASDLFGLEEVSLDGLEWDWDSIKAKAEELGRGIADKLNNFFSNEEWAKELGHNIAEALNTALHFAYGFIDELDWKQMGRWFGTLIQEGLETFEWDLLGETIGKLLNGVADTIIGFFERYQVGTLGSKIAEMFNKAIETVDPQKLGEAAADVLKAPLIELTAFFTETNWNELGRKLSDFFHEAFTSKELNGQTLGETIGNLLESALNAGLEFLRNVSFTQLLIDLTLFFEDLFGSALDDVHWDDALKIVEDVFNGLCTVIVLLFMQLGNRIAEALNLPAAFPEEEIEAIKNGYITAFDLMTDSTDNFKKALYNIEGGTTFSRQELEKLQKELGLTDSQMDGLIKKMLDVNPNLDLASLGLDNYKGSWSELRKSVDIDSDGVLRASEDMWSGTSKDFRNTKQTVKEEMEESTQKVEEFKNKVEETQLEVGGFKKTVEETKTAHIESATAGVNAWTMIFEGVKTVTEKLGLLKTDIGSVKEATEEVTTVTQEAQNTATEAADTGIGKANTLLDPLWKIIGRLIGIEEETEKASEVTTTETTIVKNEWAGVENSLDKVTVKTGVLTNEVEKGIDTSKTNIKDYDKTTVDALSNVQTKFTDVSVDFTGLAESIQLQLDGLIESINTWYETIKTNYFGYDVWYQMLQDGPMLAMNTFITTDFLGNWDIQLQTWWESHVKPWFLPTKWEAELFTPLFTSIKTKWDNLMKWWDTSTKTWFDNLKKKWQTLTDWFDKSWNQYTDKWFEHLQRQWDTLDRWWNRTWEQAVKNWFTETNKKWDDLLKWFDNSMKDWWEHHVKPYFEDDVWYNLFHPIQPVAEDVFSEVENSISDHINAASDAVQDACQSMLDAIAEVLAAIGEAIAAAQSLAAMDTGGGGVGGSSGGYSRGGSSQGGGGGGGGFMPRLEIMHFEDNLGMSAFKFPELATGAVIPPNNKFLAVLGDQRSGTNIETPLNTMLQAFRTVMDEYNRPTQQNASMEVDGETFARLMLPYFMDEMRRQGYNTDIIEGM